MAATFSRGKVYLDNAFLGTLKSFDVSTNGNHNDVMDMNVGLAGRTIGAQSVDVSLSLNCPKDGLEVDLEDDVINAVVHQVSVFLSGEVRNYEGWFTSVKFAGSADNNSSYDLVFRGKKLLG